MEGISESIMTVVVTDSRHQGHEGIHIRQPSCLDESTFRHKEVDHLQDISGMHIVVILHCLVVSLEDLLNKVQ